MDNFTIDIQIESNERDIPLPEEFIAWVKAALTTQEAEITIRIVDEEESERLNNAYRNKNQPTNVLSFPFESHIDETLHGDLVICAPVVNKEAKKENKPPRDHFAHLTIHGTLHLQGYDHIKDDEAKIMEEREIAILSALGIPNPYE